MRERLRGGSACLGFVVWTVGWIGWSRGQEGVLGSRVRLLGPRAFERGGGSAWGLGSQQWGGQGGLGA